MNARTGRIQRPSLCDLLAPPSLLQQLALRPWERMLAHNCPSHMEAFDLPIERRLRNLLDSSIATWTLP